MRLWFVATYGAIEMCFDWLIDYLHKMYLLHNMIAGPEKTTMCLKKTATINMT